MLQITWVANLDEPIDLGNPHKRPKYRLQTKDETPPPLFFRIKVRKVACRLLLNLPWIKKIPKKPHNLIFNKISNKLPKSHRKTIRTRSFVLFKLDKALNTSSSEKDQAHCLLKSCESYSPSPWSWSKISSYFGHYYFVMHNRWSYGIRVKCLQEGYRIAKNFYRTLMGSEASDLVW